MILYALTIALGTVVVALNGFDLTTSLGSVIACVSNIGPGFGLVGPSCNYILFSGPIKFLLAMFMIAGRLELYTIFIMFTRTFWNENR